MDVFMRFQNPSPHAPGEPRLIQSYQRRQKMFNQTYAEFTIKWVTLPWEVEQAYDLRRKVFCAEQGIFIESDVDATDSRAQLLVAIGSWGGWHDRVVGTVRIHREGSDRDNIWYGSRLAVDPDFRKVSQLGSTLIKLAVSSARALGCEKFYAHVQSQNEKLFQRLHWQTLEHLEIRNRPHVFMQADLQQYPPCHDPRSGFVVHARQAAVLNWSNYMLDSPALLTERDGAG